MVSCSAELGFLYHLNPNYIKFGLSRIENFLKGRKNPHHQVPSIHIAGTNGKGSVCHYLFQLAKYLGFKKIGVYTSPHLVDFRERIQVNQELIDLGFFKNWIHSNKTQIHAHGLTYFETITALAFEYFQEQNCDLMIIETGLGGRLDATNVLNPLLSIITSIDYDHVKILGPSLIDILREKAGILKPGVPLVVAKMSVDLELSLLRWAKIKGVQEVYSIPKTVPLALSSQHPTTQFRFADDQEILQITHPSVLSQVQLHNLNLALEAGKILKKLSQKKWTTSHLNLNLPLGRCTSLSFPGRAELLLDVAHNPAGFLHLQRVAQKIPKQRHWVICLMPDKDISGILKNLAAEAGPHHWLPLYSQPRYQHQRLESLLQAKKGEWNLFGIEKKFNGDTSPSNTAAKSLESQVWLEFEDFWKSLHPQKDLVVLAGSFYLVGEFLQRYPQARFQKRIV